LFVGFYYLIQLVQCMNHKSNSAKRERKQQKRIPNGAPPPFFLHLLHTKKSGRQPQTNTQFLGSKSAESHGISALSQACRQAYGNHPAVLDNHSFRVSIPIKTWIQFISPRVTSRVTETPSTRHFQASMVVFVSDKLFSSHLSGLKLLMIVDETRIQVCYIYIQYHRRMHQSSYIHILSHV